jgi:hypothetical protein
MSDHEWRQHAECRGYEINIFFPNLAPNMFRHLHEIENENAATAKRICATCPVRVDCIIDADLYDDADSIRGGYDFRNPKTRKHVRQTIVTLRDRGGGYDELIALLDTPPTRRLKAIKSQQPKRRLR